MLSTETMDSRFPANRAKNSLTALPEYSDERPDEIERISKAYELVEDFWSQMGTIDLSDGIYLTEQDTYQQAQENQGKWILEQLKCQNGSRILDIGCGMGSLVEKANRAGAKATGITIAPVQQAACQDKGLDVQLLDYRQLDAKWHNEFDGIVANGSPEHFAMPSEVIRGHQKDVYRDFFKLCSNLLNQQSSAKRLVMTSLHIAPDCDVNIKKVGQSPLKVMPFTTEWHARIVANFFPGTVPTAGLFEECAKPYFKCIEVIDGTTDYRKTSEHWVGNVYRQLLNPKHLAHFTGKLLPYALRHPHHAFVIALFATMGSWVKVMSGKNPPFKLIRYVFEHQD